jgi:hypothetical protein
MGPVHRHNLWRKRQIILPRELALRLHEAHGGQSSATYALASTGSHHLVSLSMIDDAVLELTGVVKHMKGRDKREVNETLGELETVRTFWREHSAKEAGMEDEDQGYDERDYGLSAHEESEIPTRSG